MSYANGVVLISAEGGWEGVEVPCLRMHILCPNNKAIGATPLISKVHISLKTAVAEVCFSQAIYLQQRPTDLRLRARKFMLAHHAIILPAPRRVSPWMRWQSHLWRQCSRGLGCGMWSLSHLVRYPGSRCSPWCRAAESSTQGSLFPRPTRPYQGG